MSDEPQRIPLSKKGQRQVTPFTGNELLFDYLSNALDEERRKAVATHLETSKEAQIDLQKIQNGLQYADRMRSISVSQALHDRLNTPSSYLSVLFRKARFDQWPVGVKWGLEALVVVFVIVTVLSVAPWEKVLKLRLASTNEVVLTELNKVNLAGDLDGDLPKNPDLPEFVDEDLKPKDSVAAVVATTTSTTVAGKAPTPTPALVAKASPPPTPQPVPKATAVAVTGTIPTSNASDVAANQTSTDSTEDTAATTPAAKPSGGFLYRGTLAVTNLEAVGPKIAEKITQIGGRKAGEVELGWMKNEGSAYFHFTVPAAKYDELKEFLSGYGKPVLNLEKHPRVMPDGIVRLIITVDEAAK